MNDFESTLVAALQDEADRRTQGLDSARAAHRLEVRMAEISGDRRHRRWGTILVAAVVLAVAALMAAAVGWHLQAPARIEPAAPFPRLSPGAFPSQYSPYGWTVAGQPGGRPPQLAVCLDDPSTWGALETQAVGYRAQSGPGRANQYLLLYPDSSRAHAGFAGAVEGFQRHCGSTPAAPDHSPGWTWDEAYWTATYFAGENQTGVLRVARAGNILVVMQETGSDVSDDESQRVLEQAVKYARGQAHPSPAQPWITEGTSPGAAASPTPSAPETLAPDPFLPAYFPYGWNASGRPAATPPRLTTCMDDPDRWGALRTQGRAYRATRGSGRANEYLLQYPDGPAARAALSTAVTKFKHCAKGDADPAVVDSGQGIRSAYDDAFADQTQVSAPGQPEVRFVLRVARAGNILLVLEETGTPDEVMSDNSQQILDQSIRRALLRIPDPSPAPWVTRHP